MSLNLARLEYPPIRMVLYIVCLCEQVECLGNTSLKDKYPQLSVSESHLDHCGMLLSFVQGPLKELRLHMQRQGTYLHSQ